ncbi:glycoside hydrolase family 16 protein [Ideonella sp. BN130291]|uniref:glycoside hydrolase family 16 protein n=1 Tax=Ideonella sp. BN130291 TaxID=3112940 RepID=UPI002E265DFE|nr:glycoside hydrolase family 16 protein [Ideonella sp. BN130291]
MPLFSQLRRAFAWPTTCVMPLAGALGAALPWPAGAADTFAPPPGYQLVWADEFNADGLPDPAKWVYDTARNKQGWHNEELQYYSARGPQNAVVRNGRLVITARKETRSTAPDWGGQRYTSARLNTQGKAAWTYGFFEVSAKLPCGKGTWPAIWMLGSGGRWPEDGELDIMEHVGSNPTQVLSTVHTTAGHGGHAVGGTLRLPDACSGFHRYQMHWTADEVVFGVDGFAFLRYPRLDAGERAWPFNKPQFLLLNLAIGGALGGPVDDTIFPLQMEVDYVRIYQAPPAAAR